MKTMLLHYIKPNSIEHRKICNILGVSFQAHVVHKFHLADNIYKSKMSKAFMHDTDHFSLLSVQI